MISQFSIGFFGLILPISGQLAEDSDSSATITAILDIYQIGLMSCCEWFQSEVIEEQQFLIAQGV